MRPDITHYSVRQGERWFSFDPRYQDFDDPVAIHSLRFSDGSEWNAVNGWRTDTLPEKDPWQTPSQSELMPPGPTAPGTPLTSVSDTLAGSSSSAPPEAILLEALTVLRKSDISFDLSLNVASGQWNFCFQGIILTSAAAATAPETAGQLEKLPQL